MSSFIIIYIVWLINHFSIFLVIKRWLYHGFTDDGLWSVILVPAWSTFMYHYCSSTFLLNTLILVPSIIWNIHAFLRQIGNVGFLHGDVIAYKRVSKSTQVARVDLQLMGNNLVKLIKVLDSKLWPQYSCTQRQIGRIWNMGFVPSMEIWVSHELFSKQRNLWGVIVGYLIEIYTIFGMCLDFKSPWTKHPYL